MGTVPTLRTWSSSEKITGSKLNEIRDALSFAFNPPRCHLSTGASGYDVPNNAATRILYVSTQSDTDGMYQSPGRPRVQTEGRFQVIIGIAMPSATYTTFVVQPRLNSAGSSTGGTNLRTYVQNGYSGGQLTYAFERDFLVNDYIEIFVTQASGATRTVEFPSLGTFVQMRWISQ